MEWKLFKDWLRNTFMFTLEKKQAIPDSNQPLILKIDMHNT